MTFMSSVSVNDPDANYTFVVHYDKHKAARSPYSYGHYCPSPVQAVRHAMYMAKKRGDCIIDDAVYARYASEPSSGRVAVHDPDTTSGRLIGWAKWRRYTIDAETQTEWEFSP